MAIAVMMTGAILITGHTIDRLRVFELTLSDSLFFRKVLRLWKQPDNRAFL